MLRRPISASIFVAINFLSLCASQLCLTSLCLTSLCLVSLGSNASADERVDYQRDIQPIFAEHCARCHGVDAESRQADLRLDLQESVLRGGDSGEPTIVPGHPKTSALMARIISADADEIMPPPDEKNPLSKDQVELIERWIKQGAEYATHWAFALPKKHALPESDSPHPIDRIVRAKLHELKMHSSDEADDTTLCRRLYLDLIGLPPSPNDVQAYKKDGFEATVDALLESERYGEKWARHWLDVARYSDTNGYEKDQRRDQWAWRDWVINSLNQDMPYDQFIIEQMAGDLLPNPTQEQIIATGFLRNSMLNEEGAIVAEQFRMVEMFDRLDCIGKAILGLTTQCAQCHTHKFDPLTHDEYFGMFAFLNNSYEAQSSVYSKEQLVTIDEIKSSIAELEKQIREKHPNWQDELKEWEAKTLAQQAIWTPIETIELGSDSGLNHPVQLADKSILMLGHGSSDVFYIAKPELEGATGLQIELLNHGDLPYRGPGRSSTGSWTLQEIEVFVKPPESKDWTKLKLKNATADYSQPEQKSEDGKKVTGGPVHLLIDGAKDTMWRADRGIGRRNQPSVAVIQFDEAIDLPPDTQFKVAVYSGEMMGCVRVSLTQSPDPKAVPVDFAAMLAIQVAPENRSEADHDVLFTSWRKSQSDLDSFNEKITAQWNRYPQHLTSVMHLSEREPAMRRDTYLLDRGEWDRPRKRVAPTTPAALHRMDKSENPGRLEFARWLASERSPLTARVAVNRVWQAIFGEGLVETPEDFGTRAPVPEHLLLLDWLAVDFMENDWSQKRLIKTIVSSATYKQNSRVSAEAEQVDPRNRLLARGPRFRCEAEVVRDLALSAAGILHHKLGGPPVIPPVPQNVLDYNYTYPSYWKPATGPERYRRTLYGFRKRSMPDPVMSNFDAPNGDISCARRMTSNTPIAALTGLNETVFFEAAQAMAIRILREAEPNDTARAKFGFQLCTSRSPNENEQAAILDLLASRRQKIAEGWLNPREIATGDATTLPELPNDSTPQDAAAWTLVARVLLNLDETISKN